MPCPAPSIPASTAATNDSRSTGRQAPTSAVSQPGICPLLPWSLNCILSSFSDSPAHGGHYPVLSTTTDVCLGRSDFKPTSSATASSASSTTHSDSGQLPPHFTNGSWPIRAVLVERRHPGPDAAAPRRRAHDDQPRRGPVAPLRVPGPLGLRGYTASSGPSCLWTQGTALLGLTAREPGTRIPRSESRRR